MARKKKLTDKNQYYSEVQRLVNDSSGLSVLLMKEILERAGYGDRTPFASAHGHSGNQTAAAVAENSISGNKLLAGISRDGQNVQPFPAGGPGVPGSDTAAEVSGAFPQMSLDEDLPEDKSDAEILDELKSVYASTLNCLDRLMAAGAVRDETAEEILEKYGKEAGDTVLKYGKMKK